MSRNIFQKINMLLLIFISGYFLLACSRQPVLSQLINTRMNLVLKGTYETNNPHEWSEIYQNDSLLTQPSPVNQLINFEDFRFFFDFANFGLTTVEKRASETNQDDWSFFFKERTVLCETNIANNGTTLQTCSKTNGIQKNADFFGEGLRLKGDDVAQGEYKMLAFNPRNLVTAPATNYNSSNQESPNLDQFDNKIVSGRGIIPFYNYALQDNTAQQDPRMVPLLNNSININIDSSERPYTLEVRIFLKNLMMNHVLLNPETNMRTTFIGPSDWLINHAFDNTSRPENQSTQNFNRLGGAVLMKSRIYFNDTASNLEITRMGSLCSGGVGQTNGLSYFAVLQAGEMFNPQQIPFGASKYQNNTERINNLPPASYDIYITQDRMMNTASGPTNGKDGFPESFRLCMSGVDLPASSTVNVDISSCNCP